MPGPRTQGACKRAPTMAGRVIGIGGGTVSDEADGERFVRRVRERHGFEPDVLEFEPGSTPTAATAAEQIGCPVDQIVTSIACEVDDRVVLVLISGADRIDMDRLADLLDAETAALADPDTVEAATGYPVGGVPPLGHPSPLPTYIDEGLLEKDAVYPAGGTAERVFEIAPTRLRDLTDATVVNLAED
jgi:Cys-tRNA(Pro) deacylase